MIFDVDPNMVADTIAQALEDAQAEMAENDFQRVVDKINDTLPGVIPLLAQRTAEYWKAKASGVSNGWGTKYADAIKTEVNGDTAEVYADEEELDRSTNKLSGLWIGMVEKGMKSFSIKDALLQSEKAKVSADGVKYIIVPFPVATPRKESAGRGSSRFAGREMSEDAHELVKGGGKFSGQLASGQRVSGLTRYVTRQHHEQYGTFLCVSENSRGWIHPGVPAEPVFLKVVQYVNEQVGMLIANYCESIIREFK